MYESDRTATQGKNPSDGLRTEIKAKQVQLQCTPGI